MQEPADWILWPLLCFFAVWFYLMDWLPLVLLGIFYGAITTALVVSVIHYISNF